MAVDKHKRLFELLYKRTEAGEVEWNETSEKGAYVASFSDYSIELSRRDSEEPEPSVVTLGIRGADGQIIEYVTDIEIGNNMVSATERSSFYRVSEGLYEMVRRKVLGADKALDAILNELDDDIPF